MAAGVGGVNLPWLQNNSSGSNSSVAPKTNLFGDPGTYSAAVNTNAADYDKIMKAYDELLSTSKQPSQFKPITPQLSSYNESPEVGNALANLSSLSVSGGYTPGEVGDIRARAVSPIRSIYANAQRKLDTTKAVQGGYSPNYTAATTKMARELSEQLAQANTNVEATIAQNRAQNRLSIAPSYASTAATVNSERNANERSNADTVNRINEENARLMAELQSSQAARQQAAIEGMRGLYGTQPGLTSTFGNDVVRAADLNQTKVNSRSAQDEAYARMFGNMYSAGGSSR